MLKLTLEVVLDMDYMNDIDKEIISLEEKLKNLKEQKNRINNKNLFTSDCQEGDMKIVEIPNFADLSMDSQDPYGRDMDQWPLWRTESADAVMKHINGYINYCQSKKANPFLCLYMHPWEFHPMPKGILEYGEGAVLPNQEFVKNCGEYAGEQLDILIQKLKDSGSAFLQAGQIEVL